MAMESFSGALGAVPKTMDDTQATGRKTENGWDPRAPAIY